VLLVMQLERGDAITDAWRADLFFLFFLFSVCIFTVTRNLVG
jgi:hypothetical protein